MSLLPVTRAEREARQAHPGAVIWLTGLPGAGKSTLAAALERHLFDRGCRVLVLDGDVMRQGLSSDLGFSHADRTENPKGLYGRARAGLVTGFTGVSDPYEAPTTPEVHVRTHEQSLEDCVATIIARVPAATGTRA